ncbi:MAG: toll/interleukin-1 receptor domain-containing protein [Hyphomicrobiaceae bacterium]
MTPGFAAADIFISHSSADKPEVGRIAAELKAILKALGTEMTVFIDRPLELDGVDPADKSLQINMDWAQQLNIQLEGCKVVVVFWSKNAKRSDWVQAEALRGYEDVSDDGEPKLFNVTLDSEGAEHFGRQVAISKRLACRLHLLTQVQDRSAALRLLAEAICIYVKKPRKPKPRRDIPAAVLPYLINCSSQVGDIRAELCSLLRPPEPVSPHAARRPLFAMAGRSDDSPECLLDRLIKHELPKLAKEMGLPPELQPEPVHKSIKWKRARDSSNSGAAMERDIINQLKVAGMTRERPSLFATTIHDPVNDDLKQLAYWLGGWEKAFTAYPGALAVPLLIVVDPKPWMFSGAPRGDELLRAVAAHDAAATCGLCVDRLSPLTKDDAWEWRSNYVSADSLDLYQAVTKFIDQKFANAGNGKGPRMGDFASSVMDQAEAPWWNDLKRHYGG